MAKTMGEISVVTGEKIEIGSIVENGRDSIRIIDKQDNEIEVYKIHIVWITYITTV